MNVSILGCGRWGSFIAWYLDRIGHKALMYGRPSSKHMQSFIKTRSNGMVTLNEGIKLTTDLKEAVSYADTLIISIDSQALRHFLENLNNFGIKTKTIVLCMKGLEAETGKRLSEIIMESVDSSCKSAIWMGPGHVQSYLMGCPNCMVIDSLCEATKIRLVDEFSSDLIRFYYGSDLIGNEIGSAAKNVIGIAAGVLDGLNMVSLKGALMSRGTREVARLIKAMGGNELSAYGLCHLGDYEATVFSPYSRNRSYGEALVKQQPYAELAEGVNTSKALIKLSEKYDVDLPICHAVYSAIFEGRNIQELLSQMFLRSLKTEF